MQSEVPKPLTGTLSQMHPNPIYLSFGIQASDSHSECFSDGAVRGALSLSFFFVSVGCSQGWYRKVQSWCEPNLKAKGVSDVWG